VPGGRVSYGRSDFEQGALDDLADELRRRGASCLDAGAPDRDLAHELTVDAIFEVDHKPWAVEHCRVLYDKDMAAAEKQATAELLPVLEDIGREHRLFLSISLFAPRRSRGVDPRTVYEAICQRARLAASRRQNDLAGPPPIFIYEGSVGAELSFFAAEQPSVDAQLDESVGPTLQKKRERQLRPAKVQGLPVILLLDQAHDVAREAAQVQWLSTLDNLRHLCERCLAPLEEAVDEVWLRRPDRACLRLIPPDPEPTIEGLVHLWQ
jgi:hypothetical protein